MKNLGLYLHVPFCVQKCHYCDFLSAPAAKETIAAYGRTMIKEIKQTALQYDEYLVDTIFFGGGTPSLMPAELLTDIMHTITASFHVSDEVEVTLECNPGTVTKENLKKIRECGINRLSFGLQSTDDGDLKRLGRIHTYDMFLQSYQAAREVGFENINIDLMTSLPGQNAESFRKCLEQVVSLGPEHISVYSLIVEEGTLFYRWYEEEEGRGKLPLPQEEEDRKIYHETLEYLQKHGYDRYEISNYARSKRESRHNIKYWNRSEYLGLGLGAASMVGNVRWHETDDLKEYLSGDFLQYEKETLSVYECMSEFMFLGLRMMKGVSRKVFYQMFGKKLDDVYGDIIEKHKQNGLLNERDDFIFLTEKGIDISNYVMSDFV